MGKTTRHASGGSWFGLGLAGLAFWACFSLFSDAQADTGAAAPQSADLAAAGMMLPAAPEPGLVLIGAALLAGAAIWLLAGDRRRLW